MMMMRRQVMPLYPIEEENEGCQCQVKIGWLWLVVLETPTSGSSIAIFEAAEVCLKGVTHKDERVC